MRRALIMLLLAACAGPSEETLVDELRILAVVAEPPAAGPGETVSLEIVVADPLEQGARVAAWTCVPTGETCLEGTSTEVSEWVQQAELEPGERMALEVEVPLALAGLLTEDSPELPVLFFALACAPDTCDDILDDWARGAELGSPVSDWYNEQLASPLDWLDQLPGEGTSLALTTLTATSLAADKRNGNPVLTPEFDEIGTVDDTGTPLGFSVEDDPTQEVLVYGFTTRGAFGMEAEVDEAQAEVTLYADGASGQATVWVIAQDPDGGTAVWESTATLDGG